MLNSELQQSEILRMLRGTKCVSFLSVPIPLMLAIVLTSGCSSTSTFQVIAMEVPSGKTAASPNKVSGSDCGYLLVARSLQLAVQDALAKSPGATGMKDVSVKMFSFPPVTCLDVEGTPTK